MLGVKIGNTWVTLELTFLKQMPKNIGNNVEIDVKTKDITQKISSKPNTKSYGEQLETHLASFCVITEQENSN